MYCKTFRYSLKPENLEEVLRISREIDGKMKSYGYEFTKYLMVREDQNRVEVLEVYFFANWEEWRELMSATVQDAALEELWGKFEKLVEGEVVEEDWEVLEEI